MTGTKIQKELGAGIAGGTRMGHNAKKENVGALDMEESHLNGAALSDNAGARYGMIAGGVCLVLSALGFAVMA